VTATAVADAALGELRGFRGEIVTPADPSYDCHRRVWNGSIDRFPALIACCRGVADVIAAVGLARDAGLPVAVRGGGHSYPGHSVCDDGIVIDLGPMKGIRVDLKERTARVQAGVLWGDLDRETQAFGLATTGGFVSHTGVAGLTLGGGIGWLHRKHGLTIDQLLSVDLVTADGELVKASQTENPELFWGLRGGGGNFATRSSLEAELEHDPLARGTVLALTATAIVAFGLALVGIVLLVRGDIGDERGELFDLEAQGADPDLLKFHLRGRAALVVALGMVAGLVTGAALTGLVVAVVTVTAGGTGGVPPLELVLDWRGWAAAAALFAALVGGVVALTTRQAFAAPVPRRAGGR
jgi:hypothetical protein